MAERYRIRKTFTHSVEIEGCAPITVTLRRMSILDRLAEQQRISDSGPPTGTEITPEAKAAYIAGRGKSTAEGMIDVVSRKVASLDGVENEDGGPVTELDDIVVFLEENLAEASEMYVKLVRGGGGSPERGEASAGGSSSESPIGESPAEDTSPETPTEVSSGPVKDSAATT